MQKILILLFLAFAQIDAAELIVSDLMRDRHASNTLYDSINVLAGDQTLFQLKNLKYPGPHTFLWNIEGQDTIKTSTPELEWTVSGTPGWKKVTVIAMNDKSRIDGSYFKLYVGNLEAPTITIEDGVKRPNCPLTLKARVNPYLGARVDVEEYLWVVKKAGKVVAKYRTSTDTLDLHLPSEPGPLQLKVSAVDTNENRSPAGILNVDIKAW